MFVSRFCSYVFLVCIFSIYLTNGGKFYSRYRHTVPQYYPRPTFTRRNPTNYYQHVNNVPSNSIPRQNTNYYQHQHVNNIPSNSPQRQNTNYHQHVNNIPSNSHPRQNQGCVIRPMCGTDQYYWKEKQKCVTLQEQGPCPINHAVQRQPSGELFCSKNEEIVQQTVKPEEPQGCILKCRPGLELINDGQANLCVCSPVDSCLEELPERICNSGNQVQDIPVVLDVRSQDSISNGEPGVDTKPHSLTDLV